MKKYLTLFLVSVVAWTSFEANAGVFELGGGFSFNRSNYNAGSFTRTTSYSLSLGYYFSADSEIQFLYQDSTTQNYVQGVQDIHYRDRVYSMNLLYYMLSEGAEIRPFFRGGLGQLNRDATGTYSGGYSPPGRLDQVSVIGGLGIKAKLSSRLALKAEAITYLSGGNISTWQDNITLNFGGSFYF